MASSSVFIKAAISTLGKTPRKRFGSCIPKKYGSLISFGFYKYSAQFILKKYNPEVCCLWIYIAEYRFLALFSRHSGQGGEDKREGVNRKRKVEAEGGRNFQRGRRVIFRRLLTAGSGDGFPSSAGGPSSANHRAPIGSPIRYLTKNGSSFSSETEA